MPTAQWNERDALENIKGLLKRCICYHLTQHGPMTNIRDQYGGII